MCTKSQCSFKGLYYWCTEDGKPKNRVECRTYIVKGPLLVVDEVNVSTG